MIVEELYMITMFALLFIGSLVTVHLYENKGGH